MVKFKMQGKDGQTIFGFGLVKENVELLQEGRPIMVDMKEMGLENIEFFIFYGDSLEDLEQRLAPFVGPDTIVHQATNDRR